MRVQRWEPFRELASFSDAVQTLLNESGSTPAADDATLAPATDVAETVDGYDIYVSMPGISPAEVEITVHGNVVSISGERKPVENKPDQKWLVKERLAGKFSRNLNFATSLDPDQASASFNHGVLHLHVPKAVKERPRQIRIS
ncbi:MAG: Hsp20/alpha crystallin family protein [bacterium]